MGQQFQRRKFGQNVNQNDNESRDKADDVFDDDLLESNISAGQELDAGFAPELNKFVSFSVQNAGIESSFQESKQVFRPDEDVTSTVNQHDKDRSSLIDANFVQTGIDKIIESRDSQLVGVPFEDSINQRDSQISNSFNKANNELFHNTFNSNNDSKKSGHFQINSSPQIKEHGSGSGGKKSNPSTGGFLKVYKNEPNYGLNAHQQSFRHSPNMKVLTNKPIINERIDFTPYAEDVEDDLSKTLLSGNDQLAMTIHKSKRMKFKLDESLNNSQIQTEGKIDYPDPQTPGIRNIFSEEVKDSGFMIKEADTVNIVPSTIPFKNMNTVEKPKSQKLIISKKQIQTGLNDLSQVKKKAGDCLNFKPTQVIFKSQSPLTGSSRIQRQQTIVKKGPVSQMQGIRRFTSASKQMETNQNQQKITNQFKVNLQNKIKIRGTGISTTPRQYSSGDDPLMQFTKQGSIVNKKAEVKARLNKYNTTQRDDILRETPKNCEQVFKLNNTSVVPLNSFEEILKIFGVMNYNSKGNTFEFNGQQFKLNTQEILKNENIVKIRTQRRNSEISNSKERNIFQSGDNSFISQKPLKIQDIGSGLLQDHQRYNSKTPTGIRSGAIGIGEYNPMEQSVSCLNNRRLQTLKSPLRGDDNPTSKSYNNLCLPPTGQNSNKNQMMQLDLKMHQNTESQMGNSNQKNSQRSGLSGRQNTSMKSGRSANKEKSPIVTQHALKANRLRSKSKRGNTIGNVGSLSGLQIGRQNITDHTMNNVQQHFQLDNNKQSNLSQAQLQFNFDKHNEIQRQQMFSSDNTQSGNNASSLQISSQFQTVGVVGNLGIPKPSDDYINPRAYQSKINQSQLDFSSPEQQIDTLSRQEEISNNHIESEHQVDLAFLFASPLMLQTSDTKFYDVLPPISFSTEFEQIKESIEQKNIVLNYRYSVANQKNILTALRENPIGLHFSGHGFQNTQKLFQDDKKGWMKYKNKGDVLIFERESGASDFFFTSDLQEMLEDIKKSKQSKMLKTQQQSNDIQSKSSQCEQSQTEHDSKCNKYTDLQFVYVASCHSEDVGRVFIQAGVPHVICIDQKQTILDKAAIEFSKFFYDEVFDTYRNICDAYEKAKAKVEKAFGQFQANKIMLLTNEAHGDTCPEQNDQRLQNIQKRKGKHQQCMNQVGIETDLIFLPNKVSPFICRNQEMFDVLGLLTKYNIVQIHGLPGLGKSSLLKNVTCFLGERDNYKDGIVYIDLNQVISFQDCIQIFSEYLIDLEDDQFYQSFNQDEFQQEVDRLKAKISNYCQKKMLFSLDNINHLKDENHEKFLNFITDISSPQVKILFTSIKFSTKEFPEDYVVKKIQKLKLTDSVELFMKKIPMGDTDKKNFLDYENIQDLHKFTIEKYGEDVDFIPPLCKLKHIHNNTCITTYLSKHPIFAYFAGVPLVISIVASLAVFKSLTEIFSYLTDKNGENFQEQVLTSKMDESSLINCLEYCTTYFKSKSKKGSGLLELWYMIGTQGPGILEQDLKDIMQDTNDRIEFEQKVKADSDDSSAELSIDLDREDEDDKQQEQEPVQNKEQTQTIDEKLEELIRFSLIEYETCDKKGKLVRYRNHPFVEQYILTKMNCRMRQDNLSIVCTHLISRLTEFKKEYSQALSDCTIPSEFEQTQSQLEAQIKPYEAQIMHIVQNMFKIMNHEECDASEEEKSCIDGQQANTIDFNAISEIQAERAGEQMSQSVNIPPRPHATGRKKLANTNTWTKSGTEHQPQVSDLVKHSRATLVWKNPEDKQKLQGMLQGVQSVQRSDTIRSARSKKSPHDQTMTTVEPEGSFISSSLNATLHKAKSNQVGFSMLGTSLQTPNKPLAGHYRKLSEQEESKTNVDNSLLFATNSQSEEKAKTHRKNRMSGQHDRQRLPNLAFVDAKKSFLNDREQSYREVAKNEQQKENNTQQKELDELALTNQKSSLGPFEFVKEIAKHFGAEVKSNLEDCRYVEKQQSQPDISNQNRRQSQMLKKLPTLKYDDRNQSLKNLRQSIHDKSLKKDATARLLQNVYHNPDLMQEDKAWQKSSDLQTITETEEIQNPNSAPPKTNTDHFGNADLMQMEPHEELFFHFLSILAILPQKRQKLTEILDTFGERGEKNNSLNKETGAKFDLLQQTEKRLKKFKTIVEIPEGAKLLRANAKLLELYVLIADGFTLRQPNKDTKHLKYYDAIYEQADEFKSFFEQLDFKRGLAIIDYVQAIRQIKRFKKQQSFKVLVKQSAQRFHEKYDIDGVLQCLNVAQKELQPKCGQDPDKIQNNQEVIDCLEELYQSLLNSQDDQIQQFIKFRKDIKIPNLSLKLIEDKENAGSNNTNSQNASYNFSQGEKKWMSYTDQIYNMLLNPQQLLRTPTYN